MLGTVMFTFLVIGSIISISPFPFSTNLPLLLLSSLLGINSALPPGDWPYRYPLFKCLNPSEWIFPDHFNRWFRQHIDNRPTKFASKLFIVFPFLLSC